MFKKFSKKMRSFILNLTMSKTQKIAYLKQKAYKFYLDYAQIEASNRYSQYYTSNVDIPYFLIQDEIQKTAKSNAKMAVDIVIKKYGLNKSFIKALEN